ncbi:MAG: hypothetical protein M1832_004527 [Thelocarpon impressellum]|nr:MAG: hypothetical protein M1832_004527 [Thelocarpon impressellum]
MTSASPARSPSLAPVSPARSPRLPSPPPFTEVQFGPRSPSIGGGGGPANVPSDHDDQAAHDADATRRVRPGSKAHDMASGPPLVSLGDLDSAFQLQEHLKALYYAHTQPSHLDHSVPITKETATILVTPPDGVDRSLWLYELCRLVTKEINTLILAFFNDAPPCSAATCPEMRASEWQYLCAVHDPPKPCCAIDYCCHTLDWAANILTSTKTFPSRLTLGNSESGSNVGANSNGLRNLQSVSRRLYRIFAHAWYQHRSMFWQVEAQTGLYVFFKTICDAYQLIEEGNYTVPPEAEGIDLVEERQEQVTPGSQTIMQRDDKAEKAEADGARELNGTNTSRRHKSTLSTGSNFGAVQEEDEDESKEVPAATATEAEAEKAEVEKPNEEGVQEEAQRQGEAEAEKKPAPPEDSEEPSPEPETSVTETSLPIEKAITSTTAEPEAEATYDIDVADEEEEPLKKSDDRDGDAAAVPADSEKPEAKEDSTTESESTSSNEATKRGSEAEAKAEAKDDTDGAGAVETAAAEKE